MQAVFLSFRDLLTYLPVTAPSQAGTTGHQNISVFLCLESTYNYADFCSVAEFFVVVGYGYAGQRLQPGLVMQLTGCSPARRPFPKGRGVY